MILIVTSYGSKLENKPCPRFGRSPVFIRYDLASDDWEAIDNPEISQFGGAGVAASQFIINKKASVVISGTFGPNAFRVLDSAGIKMFVFDANCETVRAAIEGYRNKTLTQLTHP